MNKSTINTLMKHANYEEIPYEEDIPLSTLSPKRENLQIKTNTAPTQCNTQPQLTVELTSNTQEPIKELINQKNAFNNHMPTNKIANSESISKENSKQSTEESKLNKNFLEDTGSEEADYFPESIKEDLLKQWGEHTDTNISLVKRAFEWLNILNTSPENPINSIEFLNKLVDLGTLLSEDRSIHNNAVQNFNSAIDAKKQRTALTSDPEFMVTLTDSNHLNHKNALEKLNSLNRIIV